MTKIIEAARDLLNNTDIDDSDVLALLTEATAAGDDAQVEICREALSIDERLAAAEATDAGVDDNGPELDHAAQLGESIKAWKLCEEAITAALAADDEAA